MREFLWRLVARIVSQPRVAEWLFARSLRTPYTHITSADGKDVYMGRWWLFNPYGKDERGHVIAPRWEWLPSIRIHHIRRADTDRHLHDHPWNARTIVLREWYREERSIDLSTRDRAAGRLGLFYPEARTILRRDAGYTGRLLFGQYHRITEVAPGGVWTLFFTWRDQGTWGFDVDGVKVPYREYLGLDK